MSNNPSATALRLLLPLLLAVFVAASVRAGSTDNTVLSTSSALSPAKKNALTRRARQAWETGRLWEEALAAEASPREVPRHILDEAGLWTKEFTRGNSQNGDPAEDVLIYCPARAGAACRELAAAVAIADTEKRRAVTEAGRLIRYFMAKGLRYQTMTSPLDVLTSRRGNCLAIALISLHLLKAAGIEEFRPVFMPDHVALSLSLPGGNTLYLNNGSEFLPGEYIAHPPESSPYTPVVNEHASEPWTILAGVYLNAGRKRLDIGDLPGARRAWLTAYSLNPDCPTTLNNVGLALARSGLWDEAEEFFQNSLAINPRYERARGNLVLAEAALTSLRAGNR